MKKTRTWLESLAQAKAERDPYYQIIPAWWNDTAEQRVWEKKRAVRIEEAKQRERILGLKK